MDRKILFYGVSSHLGGAERSLLDFLKYYKTSPNPCEFWVLLPKAEGPLPEQLKLNNIHFDVIPFPYFWLRLSRQSSASQLMFFIFGLPSYFLYLCRLLVYLKKHEIFAIHSTGIKCHITLCLLEAYLPSKIVIHFRDLMNSPLLQKFFLLFSKRKKIVWITASRAISETFPQLPTEVAYCGFCEEQYFPQKNKYLHDLLNIPHTHRLIGLVGVWARWKGQKEFILASHIALQSLENCHFLLVGGQIYDTSGEKGFTEELKNIIQKLERDDRIHFVPFQKDPTKVYNSLDLLVHCSILPEPFGRVIVEGLFCEVPVIVSAAGGALEIIHDESFGLTHKPGDVEELARQMVKSLNDPQRNEKAILAAKKARLDYGLHKRFSYLKEIIEN